MKRMLRVLFYRLGLRLFPATLFRVQHWRMHKKFGRHSYWAQLRMPQTFNEKLLRSKLEEEHRGFSQLVDKADVKAWVASRIGDEHIIPTLGVYERPEDVPIARLTRPCILKPTHASGKVIFLRGGQEPANEQVLQEMRNWQKIDHYLISGEPQYRDLKPRIICEPLIGAGEADLPDYKFFCFEGEPRYVQVDLDRHIRHVRRYYDCSWQTQAFTLRYPIADRELQQPPGFQRMLEVARTLAKGLGFVRVDLYDIDGQVFFGELTFHPESGNAPFSDYETDLALGKLLQRPTVAGTSA